MAKFTDYTEKTEPVDTDLALIYDTPAKVNKKFTFGNLWKWIAKKIVSEGISQLNTTNKTIPGAINELNSNTFLLSSPTKKLDGIDLNKVTVGIYAITAKCLNAPPVLSKGTLIVSTPENADYIRQIYIGGYNNDIYSRVRYYNNSTSKFEWREWKTIIAEYI